jgi:nitrite reductase/ring-hydroxylating ferredoxin subunit
MPEVLVCRSEEIKDGAVRIVEVGDVEFGLIRHNGKFYAYRNVCPHQGGPVCEGLRVPQVIDCVAKDGRFLGQKFDENDVHIVCPWHGYEYHLTSGEHVADKNLRLQKFQVNEREGDIYVTL